MATRHRRKTSALFRLACITSSSQMRMAAAPHKPPHWSTQWQLVLRTPAHPYNASEAQTER